MRFTIFLGFLAIACSACGSETKPTRALVEVYSDLGEAIADLRVEVTDQEDPARRKAESIPVGPKRASDPDNANFLLSFAVAPSPEHDQGRFLVEVTGVDGDGNVLVSARALGQFAHGSYVKVRINLARACAAVECSDPEQTCSDEILGADGKGRCVPLVPVEEGPMRPDASAEGGARDAGSSDGEQAVRTDAASVVGLDAASTAMPQHAAADAGASPDASGEPSCQAATETCDGADNDCDGEIDDGVKIRCWADADGDGYAGASATLTETCDACGAKQTAIEPVIGKIDCDDASATMSPGATDVCGDSIDNDCDGTPDDESNNACGGPCSVQLPGKVSDPCNNGQQGACARAGTYECKADHSMVCNAPTVQPAAVDTCGDGSDNDCDGHVDEDGITWYPDCDGDGFAGGGATKTSCSKPASATDCAYWVNGPIDNMDCDDGNAFHYPGATYDLGLPTPAFSDGNGVWQAQALSIPFPDTKLFDGDVNCDGRAEQVLTMFERKTESSTEYVKYQVRPACTSQNKCATGATSELDECYEYALTTSVTQCGLVPFFIIRKNDVTGACVRSDKNLYIVCR